MAKIRKSGKNIVIKFDSRRESTAFLRAAGFKNIPALQEDEQSNNASTRTGGSAPANEPDSQPEDQPAKPADTELAARQ